MATNITPWTWKQFHRAMQKDDWRLNSTKGCFERTRPKAMTFAHLNWDKDKGRVWQEWAAARMTPPPFG